MHKKNNAAFPLPGSTAELHTDFQGLTKREYFAGLAMQGELASQDNGEVWSDPRLLAQRSVELADALCKELHRGQ